MRKGTPTYKMSKSGKINLATNWHKDDKASRCRSIVDSEIIAAETRRAKQKSRV